jgi:glycerol-3-phosphate O-acyltransferase
LDVFGNFVDPEGNSIGPNGTRIDPVRWLTTRGEIRQEPQRDQEYTRELGLTLSERFHKENTVLTSHLVAFAYFETLRNKYPDFDLYRFLRLSQPQRAMLYPHFLTWAENYYKKVLQCAERGELFLSEDLLTAHTQDWVRDGVKQLGLLHDVAVVKVQYNAIWTEDMNLLYYYRNRLSGYGLSRLARDRGPFIFSVEHDSQGFLA